MKAKAEDFRPGQLRIEPRPIDGTRRRIYIVLGFGEQGDIVAHCQGQTMHWLRSDCVPDKLVSECP